MILLEHGKKYIPKEIYVPVDFMEYGVVETLEPVKYIDKHGVEWDVPKGTVSDAFSIPRIVWSLVGHPFYGKSIIPALVHDRYCLIKERPHKRTHKVFGEIMEDVDEKLLRRTVYGVAVSTFGPKW